jgi:hypothetical protein
MRVLAVTGVAASSSTSVPPIVTHAEIFAAGEKNVHGLP